MITNRITTSRRPFIDNQNNRTLLPELLSLFIVLLLFLILPFTNISFCQWQQRKVQSSNGARIQRFELLNGLRVLLVERSEAPTVAVNLLIKSGSMFDPPTKEGVAYLTAQGLYLANQKKSAEQWKSEMEDLGAEFRIKVDPDATVFQGEVPRLNLESFLGLLSHLIVSPLFQSRGLDKAKQQIIASKVNTSDSLKLAEKQFRALIFGKHPYGKALWGDLGSIEAIRREDVEDFYKAHYIPNNAALVIVGGISPSRIIGWVREKLGRWTKGNRIEIQHPELASKGNFSMFVVERRDQAEAALVFGHLGPPRSTADFYSLEILNSILGGLNSGSRLAREFRTRNLDYHTLKSKFQFYQARGQFQVVARVPATSASTAIQVISDVIETVKTGVTESELNTAKASFGKWYAKVLNSPLQVADQATSMELYNLAGDFLISFPKKIEQVTAERVEEAAKSHLDSSRALAVIVGDSEKFETELRKIGPVTFIDNRASDLQK